MTPRKVSLAAGAEVRGECGLAPGAEVRGECGERPATHIDV